MKRIAMFGLLALVTGCGGGGGAKSAEGNEPIEIAGCSDLIRAQLYLPDSFQMRNAEDVQSYRRSTRITFAANIPQLSGPDLKTASGPGTPTTCQAQCGITKEGALEPRLLGITDAGSDPANRGTCPAAKPMEAAR